MVQIGRDAGSTLERTVYQGGGLLTRHDLSGGTQTRAYYEHFFLCDRQCADVTSANAAGALRRARSPGGGDGTAASPARQDGSVRFQRPSQPPDTPKESVYPQQYSLTATGGGSSRLPPENTATERAFARLPQQRSSDGVTCTRCDHTARTEFIQDNAPFISPYS